MTRQSALILNELLASPAFSEAVGEVVAEESQIETEYMRQAVRSGQYADAARCEGKLTVWQDLLATLAKHAKKAQPPQ